MKSRSVPGGHAGLHEVPRGLQRIIGFAAHRIGAGAAVAAVLISDVAGGAAAGEDRHDEETEKREKRTWRAGHWNICLKRKEARSAARRAFASGPDGVIMMYAWVFVQRAFWRRPFDA